MNTMMRTAGVMLFLGHGFITSLAFCAEPASPNANPPAPAPSPAVTPLNSWGTAAEPAAQPPSPSPSPAPMTPGTSNAQPEANSPGSSLAPSPYGTNSPPSPSSDIKLSAPPPAEPKVVDDGPPTLLSKRIGDYAFGGFGGVTVQYTRFAGTNAVQVCGEGAVIIDHAFTLGGGGCGITTRPNADKYGPWPHDPNDRLMFGYGGAIIRYHLFSRSPINLGVGALVGAGGLSIGTLRGDSDDTDKYSNIRSEAVFVFEPEIGAYANITRWLRVGITGGYRIVSGVSMAGLSSSDVSSPVLGGTIQGGWF